MARVPAVANLDPRSGEHQHPNAMAEQNYRSAREVKEDLGLSSQGDEAKWQIMNVSHSRLALVHG